MSRFRRDIFDLSSFDIGPPGDRARFIHFIFETFYDIPNKFIVVKYHRDVSSIGIISTHVTLEFFLTIPIIITKSRLYLFHDTIKKLHLIARDYIIEKKLSLNYLCLVKTSDHDTCKNCPDRPPTPFVELIQLAER